MYIQWVLKNWAVFYALPAAILILITVVKVYCVSMYIEARGRGENLTLYLPKIAGEFLHASIPVWNIWRMIWEAPTDIAKSFLAYRLGATLAATRAEDAEAVEEAPQYFAGLAYADTMSAPEESPEESLSGPTQHRELYEELAASRMRAAKSGIG